MSEQDWIEQLLESNGNDAKFSEKQIKIIEAAIESFAEKGFAATSTSEIAKKAGVAEGTIFRHYSTKKELLMAIVIPTLSKVWAPFLLKNFVKEVFDNKFRSYEEFLRRIIINRYEFVQKHLPILKIVLHEAAFHPEIKQVQNLFMENVYGRFVEIVKYFQDKGEIVDFPPETVIRMTMTTIVGHMITRFIVLPHLEWDDETEFERTIQFIMHGLSEENKKP